MPGRNPQAREFLVRFLRQNADASLGDARAAAGQQGVTFSDPTFYNVRRDLGNGARATGSSLAALDDVRSSLESTDRMRAALEQIAAIVSDLR